MDRNGRQHDAALIFSTPPEQIVDGGFLERLINSEALAGRVRGEGPVIGIKEEPEWFVVHAELPGMDPRNVEVRALHGVLTLAAVGSGVSHRSGGAFLRTLALPGSADPGAMLTIRQESALDVLIPKSHLAHPAAGDD